MKPTQSRLILAFLVIFLTMCHWSHADENQKKEARLNLGYYFYSINETANRADVEVSLNFWVKDLFELEAKKLNFSITSSKAFLFDHIEDMKKAFEQGELDMIIAPPLLISRYFKRQDLGDGFAGVREGKKSDYVLLIVRTDKNIGGIKDLHGKRLVIQDNNELADIFLDTLTLKALGQSYKNMGLSIQHQNKSNRIILDVFFDKADAAVIYRSSYEIMAELNPEITNKIKILAEYPIKSKNFSYFRHNYPLIMELNAVAMGFSKSARGKQILEVFKTPEIDYCNVADLDNFDKFYKDYLQLKQHAKK